MPGVPFSMFVEARTRAHTHAHTQMTPPTHTHIPSLARRVAPRSTRRGLYTGAKRLGFPRMASATMRLPMIAPACGCARPPPGNVTSHQ